MKLRVFGVSREQIMYLPVEVNLPLEEPVPHDHGAEVLGHDLDKEVEDHRLPPLRPLAPLDDATLFITFEVDVYEDFAGVGIENFLYSSYSTTGIR